MTNTQKKYLKKYYRDIRKYLSGKKVRKQNFFHTLENNLELFLTENPSAQITDIYEQFGTAEDIAEAYLENAPRINDMKHLKKRKFANIILAGIIIIMIAFFTLFIYELRYGYAVTIEETIEQDHP